MPVLAVRIALMFVTQKLQGKERALAARFDNIIQLGDLPERNEHNDSQDNIQNRRPHHGSWKRP